MHLAAQLPAATFGLEGLMEQFKTVFILLIIGAGCWALWSFKEGKIGKALTIVAIILVACVPLGIASGGTGLVSAIGSKIVSLLGLA